MITVHTLLVALLGATEPRVPTGNTVYVAQVNDHTAYCAVSQRDKGCYNLLNCEDGRSYFCVQNVEMRKDTF